MRYAFLDVVRVNLIPVLEEAKKASFLLGSPGLLARLDYTHIVEDLVPLHLLISVIYFLSIPEGKAFIQEAVILVSDMYPGFLGVHEKEDMR